MLPRNKIKFLIKLQYAHNMICKLFMKNISDELTNLFAADFDDYVLWYKRPLHLLCFLDFYSLFYFIYFILFLLLFYLEVNKNYYK